MYRSKACEARLRRAAVRWRGAGAKRSLQRPGFNRWILYRWFFIVVFLVFGPIGVAGAIWDMEVTEWRVAWWMAVSALLLLGETRINFAPKHAQSLAMLPVSHRAIADEALRKWRRWLMAGVYGWFVICSGIPPEGSAWEQRIWYAAMGSAGFVTAGLLWWLGTRIPWAYSWLVPAGLFVLLGMDIYWHDKRFFSWLPGLLESAALILPWQWGFIELREMNFAAFLPWLVLLMLGAVLWVRWNHQRVRALFVFDRCEQVLLDGDEDLYELDEEMGAVGLAARPELKTFSPPEPEKLGWVEQRIWNWLNPEQRWLANLGGIEGGNFLQRQRVVLYFILIALALFGMAHYSGWEVLRGWPFFPLLLGFVTGVPWLSNSTERWTSAVRIDMAMRCPLLQFYPLSLREVIGLRIKEAVWKILVATPLLTVTIVLGRQFSDPALSPELMVWEIFRPVPLLVLGSVALFSVGFANPIVATGFSRKGRGSVLRVLIQIVEIVQVLLAVACGLLAMISSIGGEGRRLDYVVVIAVISGTVLLNLWLLKVLIRRRIRNTRCDLLVEV